MRTALFSMDLEEWFDLKYLESDVRRREPSVVDGVDRFRAIVEAHGMRCTFFVLGTFLDAHPQLVASLAAAGHEIALHGADHRLLYDIPDDEFARITRRAKERLEDATGRPVEGFRASCFSMTRAKLELLPELGFRYDSSRSLFEAPYAAERLDLAGWPELATGVHARGDFVEFDLTSTPFLGRRVNVAGGGYFRLMPWPLFRFLVARELRRASVYSFYLHPFETSTARVTSAEVGWSWTSRFRFQVGRRHAARRLEKLAALVGESGFEALTYGEARRRLLTSHAA